MKKPSAAPSGPGTRRSTTMPPAACCSWLGLGRVHLYDRPLLPRPAARFLADAPAAGRAAGRADFLPRVPLRPPAPHPAQKAGLLPGRRRPAPDGSAVLEFSVSGVRYRLDVPREEKLDGSGMVNIWYDPDDPRNVFFGLKKPEKASPFALSNIGILLSLSGVVNAVFYLFLF